jgi:hypothetical protein
VIGRDTSIVNKGTALRLDQRSFSLTLLIGSSDYAIGRLPTKPIWPNYFGNPMQNMSAHDAKVRFGQLLSHHWVEHLRNADQKEHEPSLSRSEPTRAFSEQKAGASAFD